MVKVRHSLPHVCAWAMFLCTPYTGNFHILVDTTACRHYYVQLDGHLNLTSRRHHRVRYWARLELTWPQDKVIVWHFLTQTPILESSLRKLNPWPFLISGHLWSQLNSCLKSLLIFMAPLPTWGVQVIQLGLNREPSASNQTNLDSSSQQAASPLFKFNSLMW